MKVVPARRSSPCELIIVHHDDDDDDGGGGGDSAGTANSCRAGVCDQTKRRDCRREDVGETRSNRSGAPGRVKAASQEGRTAAGEECGRHGNAGARPRGGDGKSEVEEEELWWDPLPLSGEQEMLRSSHPDEVVSVSSDPSGDVSGEVGAQRDNVSDETRRDASQNAAAAAPGNRAGAGLELRTRSRAGKQGRVDYFIYFGDEASEHEEEEEEDGRDGKKDDEDGEEAESEKEEEPEEKSCHTPSNAAPQALGKRKFKEEEVEESEEESCHTPSNPARQVLGKRKFEGAAMLAEVENTKSVGVGHRTRSHFRSCSADKGCKLGTFSRPLCIDVSESGSRSEEEPTTTPPPSPDSSSASSLPSLSEQSEADHTSTNGVAGRRKRTQGRCHGMEPNAECYSSKNCRPYPRDVKGGSNGQRAKNNASYSQDAKGGLNAKRSKNNAKDFKKRKRGRMPKGKRGQMLKGKALFNILMNTIYDEMGSRSDDFVPHNEAAQPAVPNTNRLPIVFSFGDGGEKNERPEHDMFLDGLWTDFDFTMESVNIGVHHDDDWVLVQKGNEREASTHSDALCSEGKHHFIIDEQLGIMCKYCSFVDLEIRYVMPSLGKFFGGRESLRNPDADSLYDNLLAQYKLDGKESSKGHRKGTAWDLIPGVREDMFPHQREGFEFAWRNLAGGIALDELRRTVDTDIVGGCVISHAPGTGKTRLALAFVQSYLEVFPRCRPVIIAPKGMLATWDQEFKKWKVKLPLQVLNSSELHWYEDATVRDLAKNERLTEKSSRIVKLLSWHKGTSILGVSYKLFQKLATDKRPDGQVVRKMLLENPGLLVLDEGHTPRNERSKIWKVLAEVRTEKRIILSGTPFQNNFVELYNILCLVRPKFARRIDSRTAGRRSAMHDSESMQDMHVEKDDGKDLWTSLTSNVTDDNVDEVRSILEPFVHIHNGDILRSLPGLRESVVILNPLSHQKEIIKRVENTVSMGALHAEYKISLASVHPSLITSTKFSDKEASLFDMPFLEGLRSDPYQGVKTRFVVAIVRLCEALKERVLVFSQYLEPLSLIQDQLISAFGWSEGREVLQMSGKMTILRRQGAIKAFNDMKSEARVMLASTKACSEGITLTGASRVVLLDVVWNPAVGKQAIARAYRMGQERIVYTYNLIAEGTKEMEKYDRQAEKDRMSKLLFSQEPQNGRSSFSEGGHDHSSKSILDKIMEEMTGHDEIKDMFVEIHLLH